jgi:uncharacterized protein (TIGR02118 family)
VVRVHIWLRRKDGMSPEEFREHWVNRHVPIARDGYEHLLGYTVHAVTRVPEGQEAPYDGVAVLTWGDRDAFREDMRGEAAKRGTDDLATFTSASGLLFVDEMIVK